MQATTAPRKGYVFAQPRAVTFPGVEYVGAQPKTAVAGARGIGRSQTGTVAGMSPEAAEQRRLQEISEIAGLFDLETVRAAMYGPEACTAQEMAYRALRKMATEGRQSDVENPAAIEAQAVADARAWNQLMADTR